jgi:hypothetical protein
MPNAAPSRSPLGHADTIELRRVAWLLAAERVLAAGRRFLCTLEYAYSPNQPRVPAGSPDGGQWTRVGLGGQ